MQEIGKDMIPPILWNQEVWLLSRFQKVTQRKATKVKGNERAPEGLNNCFLAVARWNIKSADVDVRYTPVSSDSGFSYPVASSLDFESLPPCPWFAASTRIPTKTFFAFRYRFTLHCCCYGNPANLFQMLNNRFIKIPIRSSKGHSRGLLHRPTARKRSFYCTLCSLW